MGENEWIEDQTDFTGLYQQMAPGIYKYLLKLCKCPQKAEELLQETFFSVYQNMHTVKDNSSIKNWTYTIATNKFRDYMRREHGKLMFDSELVELQPCSAGSTSEAVIRRQELQKVRQAVDDLPPKLRATLFLVRFEGLKYREAAEILGVSTATVRMQIHRSMKILTQQLGVTANG
jgi:RNA polymerase sigma-70 factor (ECF subfamily)